MTAEAVIAALALPREVMVNQRVPKKLLLEHGAPSAADRRLIQRGIEEAVWVAALKPATVGTAPYHDEVREYVEIAVITTRLHADLKDSSAGRLVQLLHRAVPYPVVLVAARRAAVSLSLAHKRRSRAGAEQWVTERVDTTGSLSNDKLDDVSSAFLASLALADQPGGNLFALYQGWMDRLTALGAARVTGRYRVSGVADDSISRRAAIEEYGRIKREAAALRAQTVREKQIARRVELNLNIRQLEARLSALVASL